MPQPSRIGLIVFPFFVFAGVWFAFRRGFGAQTIQVAEGLRQGAGMTFGILYMAIAVLTIIAVFYGLIMLGKVQIGGKGAFRRVTPGEAIAVGFAASTSIGLLFWAAGEPLFHVHRPPGDFGITPLTRDAQIMARAAAYLHWGVLAHMTYALFLIGFSVSVGTLRQGRSATSLYHGYRLQRLSLSSDLLDGMIIIFATLALIAMLGGAVISVSAEIVALMPVSMGPAGLLTILLLMVFAAIILAARPIGTSMAAVSRAGLATLMILLLLVFILGPKGFILTGGFKAIWVMLRELPDFMLAGIGMGRDDWTLRWTITHFGNWIIFAPLVGYFLSRAARGYSVSEAVVCFAIVPMLLTILAILIFGGLALSIDSRSGGGLWSGVEQFGTDSALLRSVGSLWGAPVLKTLLLLVGITAFVTFAAAIIHAILHIAVPGEDSDRRVITNRRVALVLFGLALAFAGWACIRYGGMGSVAAVGRLGVIPGVLITLACIIGVLRLGLLPAHRLKPPDADIDASAYRTQTAVQVEPVGSVKLDKRRGK